MASGRRRGSPGSGAGSGASWCSRRPEAEDEANAAAVPRRRFVYLGGGSPMHLRSVLKSSLVWEALLAAWRDGAVVAGSSAGAMVLTDPMVDPRGGALTVGLGMLEQLAVIPHFGHENAEKVHRSIALAAPGPAGRRRARAHRPHPRPRRVVAPGRRGRGPGLRERAAGRVRRPAPLSRPAPAATRAQSASSMVTDSMRDLLAGLARARARRRRGRPRRRGRTRPCRTASSSAAGAPRRAR